MAKISPPILRGKKKAVKAKVTCYHGLHGVQLTRAVIGNMSSGATGAQFILAICLHPIRQIIKKIPTLQVVDVWSVGSRCTK